MWRRGHCACGSDATAFHAAAAAQWSSPVQRRRCRAGGAGVPERSPAFAGRGIARVQTRAGAPPPRCTRRCGASVRIWSRASAQAGAARADPCDRGREPLAGRSALWFASFQTERFYRQTQARWRELSAGATLTLAFADFDQLRTPRDSPAEIPVDRSHPLAREWTVVCCAADHAACLTAVGTPRPQPQPAPGARVRIDLERRARGRMGSGAHLCRDRRRAVSGAGRAGATAPGASSRSPHPPAAQARRRDHQPHLVLPVG